MANLLDRKQIPTAKRIMVFGGPGTGKTHQIGMVAKQYKVLWLDLDQGVDTLYHTLTDEQLANVEYIAVRDGSKDAVACDTIAKLYASKQAGWICADHSKWVCPLCAAKKSEFFQIDLKELTLAKGWVVVVDSGTHVSESCVNKVLVNSSIDLTTAAKDDKTTFAVWLAQGTMLHRICTDMQNSVVTTIMSAHEIEVEMPDKSKKLVPNMGTRKFAAMVNSYFSNAIRTSQVNGNFKLESLNGSSFVADVGGHVNLDLNKAEITLVDYLQSSNAGVSDSDITTSKLGAGSSSVSAMMNKFAAQSK